MAGAANMHEGVCRRKLTTPKTGPRKSLMTATSPRAGRHRKQGEFYRQEEESHNRHMRRGERRAHAERMKARALRVMQLWHRGVGKPVPTEREIGRNASVHCRMHSGWVDRGKSRPELP